ncbi:glycosyltransferase family 4 protein [Solibacillus sp. FSL K6-4121]|uniref:glycosyltransferase family 4 protein n=1 Tax=Solibacillus sp. FSL K6-4121 TaxID=2921505 RepID=UPI0030FCB819
MKIAYFSPLNPLKSGISDYSEQLLKYLQNHFEIDIFVDDFTPENKFINENFKIFDYIKDPSLLEKLKEYDHIVYNIGNNPHYHSNMYDVFLKYNGVIILHDFVLYFLITGYYLETLNSEKLFLNEMVYNDEINGEKRAMKILSSSINPLQFDKPHEIPLNKRLINSAKAIIVHSDYARNKVLEINPAANCIKINQIGPDIASRDYYKELKKVYRKKYGIKEDEVLISSFGYVSPTKRIDKVLEALASSKDKRFKYLLVGEGDYIDSLIKKYGLEEIVIKTGFTDLIEFDDLIACSDIVVNLRYPYMGETSATMIRALCLGKPTIVSNIGWFSEIDDASVIKIEVDNYEVENLKKCLSKLLDDSNYKESLGQQAKIYAEKYLDSHVIAKNFYEFLNSNKESLEIKVASNLGVQLYNLDLIESHTTIDRLAKTINVLMQE